MPRFATDILLTGATGFLGSFLRPRLARIGEVLGVGLSHCSPQGGVARLDLTDAAATERFLDAAKPRRIVHAAALTDVDRCQREPEAAYRLNVLAAKNLAHWVRRRSPDTRLLAVSTDQVYSGRGPHPEFRPAPCNIYGLTKLAAEDVVSLLDDHLIVRTNFFGLSSGRGSTLGDFLIRALGQGRPLRLFRDVFFNPLYVEDLCEILAELLESRATGVLNCGGAQSVSKLEFALRLAAAFGFPPPAYTPVSVADAALAAPRPLDMTMNVDAMRRWRGCEAPGLDAGLARMHAFWVRAGQALP